MQVQARLFAQTPDTMRQVLAPKAAALQSLQDACWPAASSFDILFSSVSSIAGDLLVSSPLTISFYSIPARPSLWRSCTKMHCMPLAFQHRAVGMKRPPTLLLQDVDGSVMLLNLIDIEYPR